MLLSGAFVLTVTAALVVADRARGETVQAALWVLAGGLLVGVATGGFVSQGSPAALIALQDQIERMRTTIKEFSNSQGRFVGSLVHEIKTPLTIVLNQAELLLRCVDDPVAVRSHARRIADYMLHLSDLFDSFLRLARPYVPEDTSLHVPVYIHDVVLEAVRSSQAMAQGCEVRVVATLAEAGNENDALEVMGDAVLLEAMLENVVRNAVRCSPRGSRVDVRAEVRGPSILLHVRDHGAGIAQEHIESVFDWTFPAPGALLRSSGSGLGLAIAKRVAEHHRGTITLHNHRDGGCEFEITLPRWRGEASPSAHGGSPIGPSVAQPA